MNNSGMIKTVIAAIAGIAVVVWLHFNVFHKRHAFYSEDEISSLSSSALDQFDNSGNSTLRLMADQLNRQCPMTIDAETRLDRVEVMPGNGLAYNYTFINKSASSVDTASMQQALKPGILSNLKSNAAFQYFRDNKITMIFNYADKDGVFLFSMAFTSDEY